MDKDTDLMIDDTYFDVQRVWIDFGANPSSERVLASLSLE
jgi:hypothetical protein